MILTFTRRQLLLCCSAAALWEVLSSHALAQQSDADTTIEEQQPALTNTRENNLPYTFDNGGYEFNLGTSVRTVIYSEMSTLQTVATETDKPQSYLTVPTGGYSEEKWTHGLLTSGQNLISQVSTTFKEMDRGEYAAKTLDLLSNFELSKLRATDFMRGTESVLEIGSKIATVLNELMNEKSSSATKALKLTEAYVTGEMGGFAGALTAELLTGVFAAPVAVPVTAVVATGVAGASSLGLEGPVSRMARQANDAARASVGTFMQQLEAQLFNLSIDPLSDKMMPSYPSPFSY
jgi:hypothetical protein